MGMGMGIDLGFGVWLTIWGQKWSLVCNLNSTRGIKDTYGDKSANAGRTFLRLTVILCTIAFNDISHRTFRELVNETMQQVIKPTGGNDYDPRSRLANSTVGAMKRAWGNGTDWQYGVLRDTAIREQVGRYVPKRDK